MNHTVYVWGAYAVAFAAMGIEVWILMKRKQSVRKPKSGNQP